jgi:hypothetical protein
MESVCLGAKVIPLFFEQSSSIFVYKQYLIITNTADLIIVQKVEQPRSDVDVARRQDAGVLIEESADQILAGCVDHSHGPLFSANPDLRKLIQLKS